MDSLKRAAIARVVMFMRSLDPRTLTIRWALPCVTLLPFLGTMSAQAQDAEGVLYSFCSQSSGDICTDGQAPMGSLISDSNGNLYGTTRYGGATALPGTSPCTTVGCGTVFELSPPASGSGLWSMKVLYSFCPGTISTCTDGQYPYAGLIFDSHGNLYGTTIAGGANGTGTVFELSPPSSGSRSWTETILSSSVIYPAAGVIFDSVGNLYGTSSNEIDPLGQNSGVGGAVFELSPPAGGSGPWETTVLYSFCSRANCADGGNPVGGLIFDANGNLYGTTFAGGAETTAYPNGNGAVFELNPPSSGSGTWTEKVLYTFCSAGGIYCTDGAAPEAGMIFDAKGNLYGTTTNGGANVVACADLHGAGYCGTVFKLSPPAAGSGPWAETVLYSFCAQSGCADGVFPTAPLILDPSGNLYGTTFYNSVAFELKPPGSGIGPWTESVLWKFGSSGESDGLAPYGGLILGANGMLYGTDSQGGNQSPNASTGGIVFDLTPPVATTTALVLSPWSVVQGSVGPIAMTATITTVGAGIPAGTVDFFEGATQVGSASLSGGTATFDYDPASLETGSYSLTSSYPGEPGFAASTSPAATLVVTGAVPSVITLEGSPNPSSFGGPVTFTATVGPVSPAPTGIVTFAYRGTAISGCSAVTLSSSHTADCITTMLPAGTDAIVATYSGDTNYSSSNGTLTQLVNPTPTAVQFVPVTPCRVVDTRGATGSFGGPELAAGATRSFTIPSGPCAGIPSTAVAYSLNVTVVPPGPLGYLTIWPTGEGQPTVSTLNSLDGRIKANAAIVPAGTGGAVSVYANNTTNVLLDIDGYFATGSSSSLEFYPLTPCRVADTRGATGAFGGPALVANKERDFPLQTSACKIPSTAQAYSLNFTVVPPATGDAVGYLTVWPEGETQPVVSTLNDPKGTTVANAALVQAGTPNGGVAVLANDATNLVIDVNGYFAPAGTGGLQLYALTPCRVLDTRKTTGAFTGPLTVSVASSACEPPSTAQGYVFNATVVPTGDLGYLTLWPDGESQPVVSTLNAEDGAITSNMAIVPNADGKTDAFASGPTQLILDISAYFAP